MAVGVVTTAIQVHPSSHVTDKIQLPVLIPLSFFSYSTVDRELEVIESLLCETRDTTESNSHLRNASVPLMSLVKKLVSRCFLFPPGIYFD